MDDIRDRLRALVFPCFLVVQADERDYRTKYRSECSGAFARGLVNNVEEAYRLVEQASYQGHPNEIRLCGVVIVTDEDGTYLKEFDE